MACLVPNQPTEALGQIVNPLINNLVNVINTAVTVIRSFENRRNEVNIPVSPGEDFNPDFV